METKTRIRTGTHGCYHLPGDRAVRHRRSPLPVPLHPKRMRQRGYNQSEWIAYGIRSATGIAVDTSSLSRIKKTESQTRKQIFERSENVEDIFRVENTDTLKNKHILLVDDVITTGSTMNACAEAMKAISGIRISILGIAVA